MTTTWVARLPADQLASVAALRLHDGLEALALGDSIYVRGTCESETMPAAIRALPGALYRMLEDEQLVEHQSLTPTSQLPIGYWAPLSEFVRVETPTAALDAEPPGSVWFELTRTRDVATPNLLITAGHHWQRFVESGADVRLRRLRFARSEHEETLIHGVPLPPLPGVQWVERSGVAVPAGWMWLPNLDADVVAKSMQLEPGDVMLMHPNDEGEGGATRLEFVSSLKFSIAHRAAVRTPAASPDRSKEPS